MQTRIVIKVVCGFYIIGLHHAHRWCKEDAGSGVVASFLRRQVSPTAIMTVSPNFNDNFTNSYTYDDLGRLTFSEVHGINLGVKAIGIAGIIYYAGSKGLV
jgi:hypothetical protein